MRSLDEILAGAVAGQSPDRQELARLIAPRNDEERQRIRAAARAARQKYSGKMIFAYGFVYLSTFCRNDCRFCAYRRTNGAALRYRKNSAEVLEAARRLAEQGVCLIDLTMGEDPATDRDDYVDEISGLIAETKAATKLPVMISPGTVGGAALEKFRRAGADWYACYQETHNRDLFRKLRQGQDYQARLDTKLKALAAGLLVEEGALCGVGETDLDLADSILAMKDLGAAQVRAMGFVPPAEAAEGGGRWVPSPTEGAAQARETDMIAALRLALPDRLIPASLDVEGLAGLAPRLNAGANVITSLVPAEMELAGVAQASLDIDNQARSVAGVRPIVENLGLRLAGPDEYVRHIGRFR